jgi:hypothetical protein
MTREGRVETTLGNLIAALLEETTRYVRDEKQAYKIVAFILTELLNHSRGNPTRQER